METVTSKDGTTIAYDRTGDGPPVVLVSGGSVDRSSNAGLAEQDLAVFSLGTLPDDARAAAGRRTWRLDCMRSSTVGG